MKIIRKINALQESNSDICKVSEYSFGDKDIDLGVATIRGRYPEKGYCANTVSKELIYVLEGSGSVYFKNEKLDFYEGDSLLIDNGEKYYWKTTYCKVALICTPAWSLDQYEILED